ncbi:MAG: hypothetical protein ACF8MJ_00210 [Phycisphaerales bacterium JB050]
MNTEQLIEMASLDALGMLDTEERAEFEAAFRAASPSIQAQIRREQKRFANADHLLPQVDPPAGLKFRVMSAVRDAIIGLTAGDAAAAAKAVSTGSKTGAWFNSTTIWRAACIGFATTTVLLTGVTAYVFDSNQAYREETEIALGRARLTELGSDFQEVALAQGAKVFDFIPDESLSTQARLWVHPKTQVAFLFCKDMPVSNGRYSLVLERDGAAPQTVREFRASEGMITFRVDRVDLETVGDLAIYGPRFTDRPDERILGMS